jgi:hypothetical protein
MHTTLRWSCLCGLTHDGVEWLTLRLVRRLSADEIATHAVGWPRHLIVEVRECAHCGRSVSRMAEAKTPVGTPVKARVGNSDGPRRAP